jgi:hypothetical protein
MSPKSRCNRNSVKSKKIHLSMKVMSQQTMEETSINNKIKIIMIMNKNRKQKRMRYTS